MSDFKSHGDKPIEFCGDQEGWIAVGSLSSDSPNSPCFPSVALLGVGLGPSGKEHPSNIAAMLTVEQTADLIARLTSAMNVGRPAPSTAVQPAPAYCATHEHAKWCEHNGGVMGATGWEAPVLDLDALAEAERAMTAGLAVEAGSVPLGDTGDYDAFIHIVDRDGRVLAYMNSPEADRSLALARGIVALRSAAPHLIAEARAAVALRAEVAAYSRLTTDVTLAINAALGNDARLGAEIHHEVTRIVGALRQELERRRSTADKMLTAYARLDEASGAEIARLTAELAAARAVPPDVEAAIEAHGLAAFEAGVPSPTLDAAVVALRTAITCAIESGALSALDEFRALLVAPRAAGVPCPACKVAAPPATVGGLLATASDRHPGDILEFDEGTVWMQAAVLGGVVRWRVHDADDGWYPMSAHSAEWHSDEFIADWLAMPARLVPADQADTDPASRGPIGVP